MPAIIEAPIPFSLTGERLEAYENQEWDIFASHLAGFPDNHRVEIENGYYFGQQKHRGLRRFSGYKIFAHFL